MTTLYLTWQDPQERQWFPVGRLETQEHPGRAVYGFTYVNGVCEAIDSAHFAPIPGFGDIHERYESEELFPLFANRVMDVRRSDRSEYLRRFGLSMDTDPMTELAVSGGVRKTDSFAVFPAINPAVDGSFSCRTALQSTQQGSRWPTLAIGEPLELDRATGNVRYHGVPLGTLPFGLMDCLRSGDAWQAENEAVVVAQFNPNAPINSRVLVDFSGKLPPGFRPMDDLPQYQPIVSPV